MNYILFNGSYYSKPKIANHDSFCELDEFGDYKGGTASNTVIANALVDGRAKLVESSQVIFRDKDYWPKVWVVSKSRIEGFFYQKNKDKPTLFYMIAGEDNVPYWRLSLDKDDKPFIYDVTNYSAYSLLSFDDGIKLFEKVEARALNL